MLLRLIGACCLLRSLSELECFQSLPAKEMAVCLGNVWVFHCIYHQQHSTERWFITNTQILLHPNIEKPALIPTDGSVLKMACCSKREWLRVALMVVGWRVQW